MNAETLRDFLKIAHDDIRDAEAVLRGCRKRLLVLQQVEARAELDEALAKCVCSVALNEYDNECRVSDERARFDRITRQLEKA